jgi:ligand-binding SRPBCC domain-containing protein
MKTYTLKSEQWFPQSLTAVFPFFADAFNLEIITPPWLHFHILTLPPIKMTEGTRIDYRLRLHGIPIRWQSEIIAWEPPHRFIDAQRRGPYRLWVHEHTFIPHEDGTLVRDEVEYAGRGGGWVQKLFIAPNLKKVFDYRRRTLKGISEKSHFRVAR